MYARVCGILYMHQTYSATFISWILNPECMAKFAKLLLSWQHFLESRFKILQESRRIQRFGSCGLESPEYWILEFCIKWCDTAKVLFWSTLATSIWKFELYQMKQHSTHTRNVTNAAHFWMNAAPRRKIDTLSKGVFCQVTLHFVKRNAILVQ